MVDTILIPRNVAKTLPNVLSKICKPA